jgi:hypothetical protein
VQCVLKREVFHKKNGEASLTESDALKNFISPSNNNETLTFGGSSSGITAAYPFGIRCIWWSFGKKYFPVPPNVQKEK